MKVQFNELNFGTYKIKQTTVSDAANHANISPGFRIQTLKQSSKEINFAKKVFLI